ncbi:MAG: response regulator [Nitrospirae bacterium]|nr:response regulator [Nitrospirota bacterium]
MKGYERQRYASFPDSIASGMLAGRGKILLVEDDDLVREMFMAYLSVFGYEAMAASDAESALRIFSENREGFSLVISDIVMPGMNGIELCETLLEVDPALKILLTSGHIPDFINARRLFMRFEFLQKPFTPEEFEQKVRTLVSGPLKVMQAAD